MILDNGTSFGYADLQMYEMVLWDASRISDTDRINMPLGDGGDSWAPDGGDPVVWASSIYQYVYSCQHYHGCSEVNSTRFTLVDPYSGDITKVVDLSPPPLQISICPGISAPDETVYYYSNGSCYGGYQDTIWDTNYIRAASSCVPLSSYQWGFSLQLLTFFMAATTIFAGCLHAVWLDTYWHTHPSKGQYTFGKLKAAMEIAAGIHREFGYGAEELTDKELWTAQRQRKAGLSLRDDEVSLHKTRQDIEDDRIKKERKLEAKQHRKTRVKEFGRNVLNKRVRFTRLRSTTSIQLEKLPENS